MPGLTDLRLVRLIRGIGRVPDLRTGTPGKKRHGDSAIAGALAYAASQALPEEYGYQPVRGVASSLPQRDPFETIGGLRSGGILRGSL